MTKCEYLKRTEEGLLDRSFECLKREPCSDKFQYANKTYCGEILGYKKYWGFSKKTSIDKKVLNGYGFTMEK